MTEQRWRLTPKGEKIADAISRLKDIRERMQSAERILKLGVTPQNDTVVEAIAHQTSRTAKAVDELAAILADALLEVESKRP